VVGNPFICISATLIVAFDEKFPEWRHPTPLHPRTFLRKPPCCAFNQRGKWVHLPSTKSIATGRHVQMKWRTNAAFNTELR
jgi:hypothetical protein